MSENTSAVKSSGRWKSKPAPYDERNNEDFKLISKNIACALEKIAHDESIPATEASLAQVARCSRGTLRNRGWPLTRLKLIKEGRKKTAVKEARTISKDARADNSKQLVSALNASRTEAAIWFDKSKQLEADKRKLQRANSLLHAENQALKKERSGLLSQNGNSSAGPPAAKIKASSVARFPERCSQ